MKPGLPRKPGPLRVAKLITNEKPSPVAFHIWMSSTEVMTRLNCTVPLWLCAGIDTLFGIPRASFESAGLFLAFPRPNNARIQKTSAMSDSRSSSGQPPPLIVVIGAIDWNLPQVLKD